MKNWISEKRIGLTAFLFLFALVSVNASAGDPGLVPSYGLSFSTKNLNDKNHTPQTVFTLSIGGKKRWVKTSAYPFTKTLIDRETGRLYFEIGYPGTGVIRAYSQSGAKIMDFKGHLLAVAPGGKFVAYQLPEKGGDPGKVTVWVTDAARSKSQKFPIGKDFTVKEMTGNGKYLLLAKEESDPSQAEYCVVDSGEHRVWELKGRGRYTGLEDHGKRLIFTRGEEKTVDFLDFKTGKLLLEMPLWKYTALHQPPPPKAGVKK